MSKKITQFFKPTTSIKRSVPALDANFEEKQTGGENDQNSPNMPANKRIKQDEIGDAGETKKEVMLSPEQKERMGKNKLKAQLIRMSKEIATVHPNIGPSWFEALQDEFGKPYFQKLNDFLVLERQKYTVFPSPGEVWSWTTRTPIRDIKVVILGQDPYHGPGQAHGLCFSVKPGIASPPSLVNMYKELGEDIPGFVRPAHGHLVGWADQGVLLLNAVLTVRSGNANSHKDKGWEKLTDAVIRWISANTQGVVFLLWGAYAQKKAAIVDSSKHHLLKTVHPSPLSAHRGFFGSKHFSRCNHILQENGKTPIDWCRLPEI